MKKKINFRKFIYWYWANLEVQAVSYKTESLLLIGWIILSFLSVLVFASANLPNNTSLMYPLQEVSKVECRTIPWEEETDSCKIELPRIVNANYQKYKNNELYTKIYTMLWEWSYTKPAWNREWSHQGVDIATAKWTPVYAIADWEVVDSRYQAWYWNVVKYKFMYNWKIYYTTNAHLSQRLVKKWDKIRKWQIIWRVWNSWFAWWAMWWYHLHFEIDKDINWRLIYAFWNCPEWEMWKNDMWVVNEGLCRNYLEERTVDPIAFLEKAHAVIKHKATNNQNTNNLTDNSWNNNTQTQEVDNSNVNTSSNVVYKTIQTIFMSDEVKDFLSKYKFEFIVPSKAKVGQEVVMKVWAKNKKDWTYFDNILPTSLEIISPDADVDISKASITYLNWQKEVKVSSDWAWQKNIVFNFGWQQIAIAKINFEDSPIVNNNVEKQHWTSKYICLYQTQEERMQYFW